MTHIELSLSPLAPHQPESPQSDEAGTTGAADPLEQWAASVSTAEECCLVLDARGIIVAASLLCVRLFGQRQATELVGKHLLDRQVLHLIDFTAAGNELGESEREQIPPLLALSSGRLARGLLRVRHDTGSRTLDSIATPLRLDGDVVGSLSFFSIV